MKWIVLLVSLPAAAIAGEPQAGVLADDFSPATPAMRSRLAWPAKNPEADMPGRPCEEHQVREAKYQALREREASRRQVLAEGRKAYDVGMQK